jgi:hypothetical protein
LPVVHLGRVEEAVIDEVHDEGRTLVVGPRSLHATPSQRTFVRDGEPSYETRLAFDRD